MHVFPRRKCQKWIVYAWHVFHFRVHPNSNVNVLVVTSNISDVSNRLVEGLKDHSVFYAIQCQMYDSKWIISCVHSVSFLVLLDM